MNTGVATDNAPSCEVPSRRRTIKPQLGKKTIICFKLFFLFVSVKTLLYRFLLDLNSRH